MWFSSFHEMTSNIIICWISFNIHTRRFPPRITALKKSRCQNYMRHCVYTFNTELFMISYRLITPCRIILRYKVCLLNFSMISVCISAFCLSTLIDRKFDCFSMDGDTPSVNGFDRSSKRIGIESASMTQEQTACSC